MTHPHRINTCSNAELAKGMFWGAVNGFVAVAIPVLLIWYFFGHLLPGGAADHPVAHATEVRIKI
jgi:hypothetical protein